MKSIALVLIAIAVLSVSGAVATYYVIDQKITQEDRRSSFEQELFNIEKDRVVDALDGVVDRQDITRGFWFEYMSDTGESELVFVSVEDLASQKLSAEELNQVVGDLMNGRIFDKGSAVRLSGDELSDDVQFHNEVYATLSGGTSTKDIQEILETRIAGQDNTSADASSLAYLYELQGDYAARDAVYQDSSDTCQSCREQTTIVIKGIVVDLKGNPVVGATISVLGVDGVTTSTDIAGVYTITAPTFVPGKLRVSALKRNFSDGVVSVNTVSKNKITYEADPIVIASAVSVVTMDTAKSLVSGAQNEVRLDGTFVIRTDQSTYEIPSNAVVHEDGSLYSGEVDVYLYEFSQGNIPDGLIQVDTFDEVRGFAGDLMKTFGMPFIQFFSPEGEELHVLSTNPMVLTYKIVNMDELRNNTLAIYGPLTSVDMLFLVESSLNSSEPYPIGREFLIENGLLRFPAFWVFDRKAGVWNSVGVSVLDTDGAIASEFYTIKN
ncbi:carboxypeptidase regulatory-like domain-containing protein [bacterium]|jgi:hypothetical protein|nr:carboxypeptidase regulatory-like domain-containing protein [bacterium]MBT3729839.1 carboxypeptidase regulatory-like domain-containing protein [bacterium]